MALASSQLFNRQDFLTHTLQQEAGSSVLLNGHVTVCFHLVMFIYHILSGMVCKWTNAEGRCIYESYWKETDDVEMKKFIGLTILISAYKSNNENVLQLWSKNSFLSLTKLCAFKGFKYSSGIAF